MLSGDELVIFVRNLVGTPYFYGSKLPHGKLTEKFMESMHKAYPSIVTSNYMKKARQKGNVGKVNVDCSGTISGYTLKPLGSYQLRSAAKCHLNIKDHKDFANGVVLWRPGHVGTFARENGEEVVYEAKGIDYGTVRSPFVASKWKEGLTFEFMEYNYKNTVPHVRKKKNPYTMPKTTLKNGMIGDGVKWLQFELVEAGLKITIDGEFGPKTYRAVCKFQESSKIEVDGIVGKQTRKALVAN